jgi:hypothetical protein
MASLPTVSALFLWHCRLHPAHRMIVYLVDQSLKLNVQRFCVEYCLLRRLLIGRIPRSQCTAVSSQCAHVMRTTAAVLRHCPATLVDLKATVASSYLQENTFEPFPCYSGILPPLKLG